MRGELYYISEMKNDEKIWEKIPTEEPDEIDIAMLSEIRENVISKTKEQTMATNETTRQTS